MVVAETHGAERNVDRVLRMMTLVLLSLRKGKGVVGSRAASPGRRGRGRGHPGRGSARLPPGPPPDFSRVNVDGPPAAPHDLTQEAYRAGFPVI